MAKPPAGSLLDPGHARCPDHCWPFLDPTRTIVIERQWKSAPLVVPVNTGGGGTPLTTAHNHWVAGGTYGPALVHTTTPGDDPTDGTRLCGGSDTDLVVPTSGGFTLVLAYRKTDATFRNVAAFTMAIDGGPWTHRCHAHIPYLDGTVYWSYGGVVDGSTRLAVGGLTFGDDLWVFTTGPRGMEVWQNGTLRGSNGANPTRTGGSDYWVLGQGGGSGGNLNGGDLAEYALVMTYTRQLSAADIVALSADPFEAFTAPPAPGGTPALFFA